ncbi:MAG: PhoH family protein [Spirochaetia bacterium]|nr:PhoH family protein [Spirochaetia bacterium]
MSEDKSIKTFVVDTNVLVHNPEAVMSFKDTEVVIPLWVLEELDGLKISPDYKGKAARDAIRFLDSVSGKGNLHAGVKLENGSTLRVALDLPTERPREFDAGKYDNRIILCAYALQQEGRKVFFVSKDINARVKATALGIRAVDYDKQKVDIDRLHSGFRDAVATGEDLAALDSGVGLPWPDKLLANEFVTLRSRSGDLQRLARYDAVEGRLELVEAKYEEVSGISALNERQRMAFDLLLDDRIKLVTLVGKAGTGKTLMAIAAGLKKILDEKKYSRMLVSRPVIPVGKDIGYLPGEKSAKMSAWMQPIFDNLEYILGVHKRPNMKSAEQLLKDRVIEIEALTYIRGRSLPNLYIVIDEAQNLTPHEVKTIVSRAGDGTKVILTGDPYQIDNMYLDANSNGLSFLVEAFKGQACYGHVTLARSERSELAELASTLL